MTKCKKCGYWDGQIEPLSGICLECRRKADRILVHAAYKWLTTMWESRRFRQTRHVDGCVCPECTLEKEVEAHKDFLK